MGTCEVPKNQGTYWMIWLESGQAVFLLAGSAKHFIFIFLLFENTGQLRKYKCAVEVNLS